MLRCSLAISWQSGIKKVQHKEKYNTILLVYEEI